jgi:hypothetical protein
MDLKAALSNIPPKTLKTIVLRANYLALSIAADSVIIPAGNKHM